MTIESFITVIVAAALIGATVLPYYRKVRRREHEARDRFDRLKLTGLHAAVTMHPHIDALNCIGCGTCVSACPEGDVLAVIDGKSTLVHGSKCVGHGLCAEACPVGAITLMMAAPGKSANLPILDAHFQTSVENMFIVGELGGMGLIRNAVTQGRQAVEFIAGRHKGSNGLYDVAVVGAGPAGLAAALTAKQHGMKYLLLEQGDVGGTILKYPRRKIVMTSPVEIPLWGKLRMTETTKEALLKVWEDILKTTGLQVNTQERVADIQRAEGAFQITSSAGTYRARHIVLALGRRGTPRRLGVRGEELGKVMYQLIDAETYKDSDLLVVGGGDSAVEAALGLAFQGSNRVTLSYRNEGFTRIKERNTVHLNDAVRRKKVQIAFRSQVRQIGERSVALESPDGLREIKNDYVFVCAGGEMPFEFLQRLGIRFQDQSVR
jgi:putative YpdA family bacillithiol system oxidoreductase